MVVPAPLDLRLTSVQRQTDPQWPRCRPAFLFACPQDLEGRRYRIGGSREHADDTVTFTLLKGQKAPMSCDRGVEQLIMPGDGVTGQIFPGLPKPSGSFDIAHQERHGAGRRSADVGRHGAGDRPTGERGRHVVEF